MGIINYYAYKNKFNKYTNSNCYSRELYLLIAELYYISKDKGFKNKVLKTLITKDVSDKEIEYVKSYLDNKIKQVEVR